MDNGRMRQTGSRSGRLSAIHRMIDRVVNLIANQLNSTRCRELVQVVEFRIADRGASRIVRTVHQNQLGISIHQLFDLLEIDMEAVLLANRVVANPDPKRLGQRGKRRIARLGQNNVRSSLRRQPKENKQRL